MGGDFGLPVTIPAAIEFARQFPDTRLLLVGLPDAIEAALSEHRGVERDRFEIVAASEVVTMDDPVEVALRRKKDSSMRLAAQSVKDGNADACISAGNTGAWMAISRYVLKTLDGIDRPAIATSIPNQTGRATTVLDLGANVDCTAEHLLQFAIMGAALSQAVDHRDNPTVGLLNIGEEVIKGNEVVKEAAELLRASPLNFYGNVEGNDIFKGTVDVVVCDGFVGNVVLKLTEGVAKTLLGMLKKIFLQNLITKLSYLGIKGGLGELKRMMDSEEVGGAPLLGAAKPVIKAHGSSHAKGIKNAIRQAKLCVANDLCGTMQTALAAVAEKAEAEKAEPVKE